MLSVGRPPRLHTAGPSACDSLPHAGRPHVGHELQGLGSRTGAAPAHRALEFGGMRAVRTGEHELTSARILGATAAIGLCGPSGVCVARKPRSRSVAGHSAVSCLQDSDPPLCSGEDSFGTF